MAPICSAISAVARAVWAASDLTSEATTAKPRPASPARAASIVALSASRLVWPAIAWISPITLPMRLAASPSSVMVWAVRCASETARAATSVDFAAWPAISPIDAASSSTEPAAEVTFCEAALTRLFGGAQLRGHRVGRAVELGRGHFELMRRAAQVAERLLDRARGRPRSRPRRFRCAAPSRARTWSGPRSGGRARSCCRGTRSRSAPSRRSRRMRVVAGIFAEMSPSASRFMTSARPLSGRAMLRPISQLKPRPISTAAMPTPMMSSGFAAATP